MFTAIVNQYCKANPYSWLHIYPHCVCVNPLHTTPLISIVLNAVLKAFLAGANSTFGTLYVDIALCDNTILNLVIHLYCFVLKDVVLAIVTVDYL